MSVKRGTADKWVVRDATGWWRGTFFFDEDTGQISIQSDWGPFHHWWPQSGRGADTLTEFLVKCNDAYIMDKFSYGTSIWFDRDKTLNKIREDLKKEFDEDSNIWLEVEELESSLFNSGENYYDVLYAQCDALVDFYGDHDKLPYFTDFHPRLRAFMKECWPLFIAEIKGDIK